MFIELLIKGVTTLHGYDDRGNEILVESPHSEPVRKLVALSRVQSVGERFLLVNGAFGRQAYWEYVGSYQQVKADIEAAGLLAADIEGR